MSMSKKHFVALAAELRPRALPQGVRRRGGQVMLPFTEDDAYALGYKDGFEQPDELTSGLTWTNPLLNEAYDRGVNAGQADAKREAK